MLSLYYKEILFSLFGVVTGLEILHELALEIKGTFDRRVQKRRPSA